VPALCPLSWREDFCGGRRTDSWAVAGEIYDRFNRLLPGGRLLTQDEGKERYVSLVFIVLLMQRSGRKGSSFMHSTTPSTDSAKLLEVRYPTVDIANALNIMRPSLGDDAGVALFRLLRLVAIEEILGRGASAMAYYAGKKLGKGLGLGKLEDFLGLCATLKIGIIDIPLLTDDKIHVDVYECVTCSGLQPVGRKLCHFEGGLIAGVVEHLTQRRTQAVEVTCIGGLGDRACGFDLELLGEIK